MTGTIGTGVKQLVSKIRRSHVSHGVYSLDRACGMGAGFRTQTFREDILKDNNSACSCCGINADTEYLSELELI